MTITKEFATKTVGLAVAAAMFFSVAMPAQAQTAEELQAMINSLLAQIAALQAGGTTGTTTTTGFQWTRDLRLGSTGADVLELQKFLNQDADTRVAATGAGSLGNETSYYGPATAAAVSKFQVKYRADILTPGGLVNPTGYFGPSSRAKANALNTSSTGEGSTGGDVALKGGEADVIVKSVTSGAISVDLAKADKVIEVELDVRDGDIELNRVDFSFDTRPWLYFDEVNLLVDGKEVGSLSKSSDFTEVTAGSDYRARFSDSKTVIRKGSKATVALELVVSDTMSSTRYSYYNGTGVVVTMAADAIRYTDAAGITSTDGVSGGLTATVSGSNSSFGSLEGSVAVDSPRSNTIILEDNSETRNETLAIARLKAKDNDVTIRSVDVELKNIGGTDVKNTVTRVRVFDGSTELGNALVTLTGATATTTVDDLSFRVRSGDVANLTVKADIVKGSALATTTGVEVRNVTFNYEDINYDPQAKTVTFNETHNLVVDGLSASLDSITTSNSNQNAFINFKVKVSAHGDEVRIKDDVASVVTSTTTLPTGAASTVAISSDADKDGTDYVIYDGQTRTVTVTVAITGNGTNTGFVKATLDSIAYGLGASNTGKTLTLGGSTYQSANVFVGTN